LLNITVITAAVRLIGNFLTVLVTKLPKSPRAALGEPNTSLPEQPLAGQELPRSDLSTSYQKSMRIAQDISKKIFEKNV